MLHGTERDHFWQNIVGTVQISKPQLREVEYNAKMFKKMFRLQENVSWCAGKVSKLSRKCRN